MTIYEKEAAEAAKRIRRLAREDSVILPIFTDLHTYSADSSAVSHLMRTMQALSGVLSPDGVIDLGDNPGMLGRDRQASNEELHDLYTSILRQTAANWTCPVYAVNGNHDGIGTDFFTPEFWYSVTGSTFDRGMAKRQGESAYYYVDFPQKSLRMIVLSLPCGSDLNDTAPTPLWKYGDVQLRWLAEEALQTERDILIVAHVPVYYEYTGSREWILEVFNGRVKTKADVGALSGWIEDRAQLVGILNAHAAHTVYEDQASGLRYEPKGQTGRLTAFLSGHMHEDALYPPYDPQAEDKTNPLPCHQIVTASATIGTEEGHSALMDVAVITPGKRELTMIRIGSGTDRAIRW